MYLICIAITSFDNLCLVKFDFVPIFRSAEEEETTPEVYSTTASENAVFPWKLANYEKTLNGVSVHTVTREKKNNKACMWVYL